MFKIYLAGYMSKDKLKETVEWRLKVRNHYRMKSWEDVKFLDPYNGKKFAEISGDGLKSDVPPQALVHRDYQCVINSDLIVANMNTFGCSRPSTGTTCELAWAWEYQKPIIIITEDNNYKEHPFLKYFTSWFVKDVDELLDKKCIDYFYKGSADAQYTEKELFKALKEND